MSVVIVTAKDGGSLLRLDHLKESVHLQNFLMNDYVIRLEDGGPFVYNDLCEPYCNANRPLEAFYVILKKGKGLKSFAVWFEHRVGVACSGL